MLNVLCSIMSILGWLLFFWIEDAKKKVFTILERFDFTNIMRFIYISIIIREFIGRIYRSHRFHDLG